jgi:hypothetical protein
MSVIDFSSGLVAHGQWKLIRTSDFCQFFSIEWFPTLQSSKLDFRIYWSENFKIRIFI